MYRLALFVLIGLIGIAVILASFNLLAFSPLALLASSLFLVIMCWAMNTIFAFVLKVPTNNEHLFPLPSLSRENRTGMSNYYLLFLSPDIVQEYISSDQTRITLHHPATHLQVDNRIILVRTSSEKKPFYPFPIRLPLSIGMLVLLLCR